MSEIEPIVSIMFNAIWGLIVFNLPISLSMILRILLLHLMIIIKSEVLTMSQNCAIWFISIVICCNRLIIEKKIPLLRVALIHRTLVDHCHCSDVIMGAMAYQITGVCSIVGSGTDQRKHQSSASLAFATV